MSEVIQENWIYFAAMYVADVGWLIYKAVFANKGKIKVRIQTGLEETIKWVKPESDKKTLIIEKKSKSKNRPEWLAIISEGSIILSKDRLGRLTRIVEIMYHAPQTISKNYDLKTEDQPKWDKVASTKYIDAKLVEKAGTELKEKSSTGIWIVAILVIVSIVINLLSSGRIRFG